MEPTTPTPETPTSPTEPADSTQPTTLEPTADSVQVPPSEPTTSPAPEVPVPEAIQAPAMAEASTAPMPTAPMPVTPPVAGDANPGKKFAVIGFVLSFFSILSVVGLVLSIMALVKSKKAGFKNGLGVAGVVLSAVNIVFVTPFVLVMIFASYIGISDVANAHAACANQSNTGMVTTSSGVMYNCNPFGTMPTTAN